ncbi:caffeoylshikimate esterase-like isoform X2 [Tasmannia lanceolata]|uniref:caffeoylshikimate esterase-like isoform X2 n=1 Tax=Tasmannia lanceolata TaxID=3420 RepID=UPI004064C668
MPMAQDSENIRYEEDFVLNPRGLKLFTCKWLPANQDPKAMVFLCHGYGMECSISMKGTGIRLAKVGYAVYGVDYQGHGKSSGLQGYIPNFDDLVNDSSDYFTSICEEEENKMKLRFLLGESMGGAVALLLHRKKPKFWDGAVLVAPMCKIAEKMKPHPLVIKLLNKVRNNPLCYKGKPRLKTGHELLRVSLDIEKTLHQVSLPFMIVHGGDDIVTDPSVSRLLHESAASSDKTFKLYPGMWHALTSGEPPENIELVFSDIVAWLDERAVTGNSRLEIERKVEHDEVVLQGKKVLAETYFERLT